MKNELDELINRVVDILKQEITEKIYQPIHGGRRIYRTNYDSRLYAISHPKNVCEDLFIPRWVVFYMLEELKIIKPEYCGDTSFVLVDEKK